MYYVYILKSIEKNRTYVGFTTDLDKRIKEHNEGKNTSTKYYRPFKMICYVAVDKKTTALELERYFKTGSGIAWMKKRLIP